MPWSTRELATTIRLLGSRYSPWRPEGFGVAAIEDEDRMKAEVLISSWTTTLASRTNREASEALHSLAEDPALEPWHFMLKGKRNDQVLARRDAILTVPDPRARESKGGAVPVPQALEAFEAAFGVVRGHAIAVPQIGTSRNSPGRAVSMAARISAVRYRTLGQAVDRSTTIASLVPERFCWYRILWSVVTMTSYPSSSALWINSPFPSSSQPFSADLSTECSRRWFRSGAGVPWSNRIFIVRPEP